MFWALDNKNKNLSKGIKVCLFDLPIYTSNLIRILSNRKPDIDYVQGGGTHLGETERETCAFSHQALFWPEGTGATVTLKSALKRQKIQAHKQMTGAHRAIGRQRREKWEVERGKRLHPRMSQISPYWLLQRREAVGNIELG